MHFELYSLIVWIALLTVNTYLEFHVNMFNNKRYYKMLKFLHDDDNAKALAIPWLLSENNQAKKTSCVCEPLMHPKTAIF